MSGFQGCVHSDAARVRVGCDACNCSCGRVRTVLASSPSEIRGDDDRVPFLPPTAFLHLNGAATSAIGREQGPCRHRNAMRLPRSEDLNFSVLQARVRCCVGKPLESVLVNEVVAIVVVQVNCHIVNRI